MKDAEAQLKQYAADERITARLHGRDVKCIGMVFSGWELKAAEEFS